MVWTSNGTELIKRTQAALAGWAHPDFSAFVMEMAGWVAGALGGEEGSMAAVNCIEPNHPGTTSIDGDLPVNKRITFQAIHALHPEIKAEMSISQFDFIYLDLYKISVRFYKGSSPILDRSYTANEPGKWIWEAIVLGKDPFPF